MPLYSEVAGTGDPVLMLHGGFCSLEALRAQSDALVVDHTVYAFERPGHGRSADSDGPYSYAEGVEQAIAYLDASGVDSVHIIGFSDGAIIGLLLALQHPERVSSLVSISGNLDPSGFKHSPEAVGQLVLDTDAGEPSEEEPPNLERMHYARLSPDGAEHGDVVLAKLFALWEAEPHIDPTDLARITVPTLVMAGDHDMVRVDHSLLIAASIPGAQLCILPGATHDLIAEHPALVSTVIRNFLTH